MMDFAKSLWVGLRTSTSTIRTEDDKETDLTANEYHGAIRNDIDIFHDSVFLNLSGDSFAND